jgi:hypothetical protein
MDFIISKTATALQKMIEMKRCTKKSREITITTRRLEGSQKEMQCIENDKQVNPVQILDMSNNEMFRHSTKHSKH